MKVVKSLTFALLTICGWLLAGVTPVHAGVFNVRDYGAVGDDLTDNTAAFSKCLDAVIATGGGRIVIPAGVYRGRIMVPLVAKPIPSWITVEIVGDVEPVPVFGTIGDFPLQNKGTIIKCLAESGDAVISVPKLTDKAALYGNFSAVNIVIKNLDVRTYDNPGIGGIDLQWAMQCKLENVFVNTGLYNVQAAKPVKGAKGLITPGINNAAWTVLRNVVVTGYSTGIECNEHTDGDNIVVASNIHGLVFVQAHHASRFSRVGAYRNTHHVTVTGKHGFSIEQLDIERAGPGQTIPSNGWQATASDVNDPSNFGVGDISYWVVVGNVGAADEFTRNGGATIRTRRIGSAP